MMSIPPLWKSIRIVNAAPGRFEVLIGVGAATRMLAEAPTLKVARERLREHSNHLKALDAEERGNRWLADGNEAAEAGNKVKAERCYEKGQFWLDRSNKLTGRD
ncbi:hypothetical protein [Burkholderia pseudomallei]|uniref:hypothetical protein n=1 Tax=Burkholderia pseudomallei TaxID=28450 RepID=UPI0012F48127|nr:hypothetical protein [Burkholderia pseudomallei]